MQNLALLFQQTGRAKEAEELYGRTLGFEMVLGRSSERYQEIEEALGALHGSSKHDIHC
jgi:hypothetical protein